MMNKEQFSALKMPFENVLIKPGKGEFKYVPVNDIIDRMNDVFQGKWSTEIVSREIIEDQILLHIRVTVNDTEMPGRIYYHDGFASQPISRFTYGDNKGKPVDIGNSYTAALSKALKQACKKWGVALNIMDEESDDTHLIPMANTAGIPGAVPNKTPIAETKTASMPTAPIMPSSPGRNFGVVPESHVTYATSGGPIVKEEEAPMGNTGPKLSGMPSPMDSLGIKIPTTGRSKAVSPMSSTTSFMENVGSLNDGKISIVQKAALSGILSLKVGDKTPEEVDVFYKEMAKAAFAAKGINKTDIPPINDLPYEDATIIVKYGNELLRSNR